MVNPDSSSFPKSTEEVTSKQVAEQAINNLQKFLSEFPFDKVEDIEFLIEVSVVIAKDIFTIWNYFSESQKTYDKDKLIDDTRILRLPYFKGMIESLVLQEIKNLTTHTAEHLGLYAQRSTEGRTLYQLAIPIIKPPTDLNIFWGMHYIYGVDNRIKPLGQQYYPLVDQDLPAIRNYLNLLREGVEDLLKALEQNKSKVDIEDDDLEGIL